MARKVVEEVQAPEGRPLNSERLNQLNEKILRELETRMSVVTDDEEWKVPTQAAIDCGLHYNYIAHAMTVGELAVSLQTTSTKHGKSKLVVVNMSEVREWLSKAYGEAEASDKSVERILSDRFNIPLIEPEPFGFSDDHPADLITLDVAGQLLSGAGVSVEHLESSITRGTVCVHDICGEKMVSENAVFLLLIDSGVPVEVEDIGECDHTTVAGIMGLDAGLLLSAITDERCPARNEGGVWLVRIPNMVEWYDRYYEPPSGTSKTRYVVIRGEGPIEGESANGHYDTQITIKLLVPGVQAIMSNISQKTIDLAIEQQMVFDQSQIVSVGRSVKMEYVDVNTTVGDIISLSFLSGVSGISIDDYMAIVSHQLAVV